MTTLELMTRNYWRASQWLHSRAPLYNDTIVLRSIAKHNRATERLRNAAKNALAFYVSGAYIPDARIIYIEFDSKGLSTIKYPQ